MEEHIRKRQRRQSPEATTFELAAIVELSDDAIIGNTLAGDVTSWNPAAERLYGYTAEEAIGKSIAMLEPSGQPKEIPHIIDAIRHEKHIHHYEAKHRRKDGSLIDVSLTVSPIKDTGGNIIGVSTITYDISERKKAEEQLHLSSQYTRSLIEASLDPLVTIGSDGKITDVNKATEEVTGVPREHLIGTDFADYFTEPDQAREGYQRVFSEGVVRDYPLAVRNVSGGVTDVLYNATVYRGEDGSVAGVFAAARDITRQKKAEEQLRIASQYARTLLEASLDPLVTIGVDGKITDVNKATEEVTGVPRERLIGTDFADYFTEPEQAREGYQFVFSKGLVRDYPLAIRHISGRITDVLYNATVFRDEAENVSGVFAAARDVTERKKAEEAVERLNRDLRHRTVELEASNRELEAFTYSVSHDLRAPLRSIDGFSQALLVDYEAQLDEEGQDYLRRVRAAAQRMGQLIDDLLRMSRVTRAEMRREQVDLSAIVSDIAENLQQAQPERKVEFIIAPNITANGDPNLLRIVLDNLLGNAWKFTGTRALGRIEFATILRDGEQVYLVRDNGVGFDMEYGEKLFVPFQRLHAQTEFPGTGIGLALIKRIIERHGGRVWAEGELEKGATIYFTL